MEHVMKFLSFIVAGLSYFFGGWSFFLTFLFILNVLDFVLGILSSPYATSSNRLYKGGIKKGIMWMWVGISNLIYMLLLHLGFDVGIVIPNFVACYYILMELVSLEENSERMGMPMPTPVKYLVNKLREIIDGKFKIDGKEEEQNGK
ncbi:hypothetical protein QI30_08845 [Kurthia sp. 3B1D]|uniref:Holin n=1 Tax=Candidatus Kurthia intestinigallinarum TaxID=1562256 RepID=A0A433RSD0_9BACL|nr:phage holin family protein [Kurthia sp. 3B1D]RUS55067.1 hypothetical protein QI30_08845 [Kurthia sp. 3B1D]